MCAIDDCDERYTVYRLKDVKKARRPHECDECRRDIAVGEPYLYAFGSYNGEGNSHHICTHCRVATNWLQDNCGGFLHHGVADDIDQHIEEYPDLKFGLYRFKVGMRRKWRRFSQSGLMPIPRQAKPISIEEHK